MSIVTGSTRINVVAVVRLTADGKLDTSFDDDGIVTTVLQGDSSVGNIHTRGNAVALQDDGKIVVAGTAFTPFTTLEDFAVVRYNDDGSLDTSFSTDGWLITDFNTIGSEGRDDDVFAIAI